MKAFVWSGVPLFQPVTPADTNSKRQLRLLLIPCDVKPCPMWVVLIKRSVFVLATQSLISHNDGINKVQHAFAVM